MPNPSVVLDKELLSYLRNVCTTSYQLSQSKIYCLNHSNRMDYIVSASFSNAMTIIAHFPYNTLTTGMGGEAKAKAGKLESWENLTCNSNTDNDPDEAPSNCSHAETHG